MRLAGALALVLGLGLASSAEAADIVRVGSKSFTESYVLAEIAAQALERAGGSIVERRLGLGGTGITFRALDRGSIDVYPEYTGTLSRVVLGDPAAQSVEAIRAALRPRGLTISDPLGFDNTYALGVRTEAAERLGLTRISDLRRHPQLAAAFSAGFMERDDGWPGLQRHYRLALRDVRVIEHALAYQALTSGTVDVIDIFSTDGRLTRPIAGSVYPRPGGAERAAWRSVTACGRAGRGWKGAKATPRASPKRRCSRTATPAGTEAAMAWAPTAGRTTRNIPGQTTSPHRVPTTTVGSNRKIS